MEKTGHREAEEYKGSQKDSTIGREVSELMKNGFNDDIAWSRLQSKHAGNRDLINAIFDAYKSRLSEVHRRAKKFRELILTKYSALSDAELFRKARKYKKKYNMSDDDFNMFFILVTSDKMAQTLFSLPNSSMAKTLGYDQLFATANELKVKPEEYSVVEEIKKMHATTKDLHAQVIIQSLSYRDIAPEAITGKYDATKHNPYSCIHPVVAALFLPRVKILDEMMLMANIGHIVTCKAERKPIMTKPDLELYWNMVSDPNDNVCNSHQSAIHDLKNRFELQTRLWEAVLLLRQGRYYGSELSLSNKFLMAVENCRNSVYESADLAYVKDEGTVMRKLLNAFSFRPTIVSLRRLISMVPGTTLPFGMSPLDMTGISNVTTVPMITLRLPLNLSGTQKALALKDSLNQVQHFIEHKMLVPKTMEIVYSRDVIFFYVARRFQTLNITRLNTPYNFNNLPMTVAGWEKLNDFPVDFEPFININNDTFNLKSVILAESNKYRRNLIVGSSAVVVKSSDDDLGANETIAFMYDPQAVAEKYLPDQTAQSTYTNQTPVTWIPYTTPYGATGVTSLAERARTNGTVYMYVRSGVDSARRSLNPLFDGHDE